MKKVGIMSMQRILNYGSYLQALALKKILKNLEIDSSFIDFKPGEILVGNIDEKRKYKKGDLFKKDISLFKEICYIFYKICFRYIYLRKLISYKKNYETNNLDALIIGSDEVFNCLQNNQNVGFSLDLFGANNQAKVLLSYAASFGNATYDKLEKFKLINLIQPLINKFDYLSVRDSNSFNIVSKMTEKKVNINLDPTLIYGFRNEIENAKQSKKHFLLVYGYFNRFSSDEMKRIMQFAKSKKLKVYTLGGPQKLADKFVVCSPENIFYYFKNASYVITDTFHGTIFSILCKKKFLTLVRKSEEFIYGNEEKLVSLLRQLNLMDRQINHIEEIDNCIDLDIDYLKVKTILENERIKTHDYLSKVKYD